MGILRLVTIELNYTVWDKDYIPTPSCTCTVPVDGGRCRNETRDSCGELLTRVGDLQSDTTVKIEDAVSPQCRRVCSGETKHQSPLLSSLTGGSCRCVLWCWVWGVEDRRELFQQESTQSKDWSRLRVSFTEILRTSAHFTLFGRQLVSLYILMGTMYCRLRYNESKQCDESRNF